MRRIAVAIATALIIIVASTAPRARATTVRDGVYAASQADRGKTVYQSSCAQCHLADLSGTLAGDTGAPPLRGEAFVAFIEPWNARQLFDYVRMTMPADSPSTLTDDQYLDILAYLFESNGFPPGSAPLTLSRLADIGLAGVTAPRLPRGR